MIVTRRGLSSRVALALLLLLCPVAVRAQKAPAAQDAKTVTVFAAASLKNALDAIGAAYNKETGVRIAVSYAASPALAKQVENGAPAQIFISADLDWMDYLDKKSLIAPGSRKNLLGNRLVLIALKGAMKPLDIKAGFDLAAVVGDGRLAVGDVASVPIGKYAKAALEKLGAWEGVKDKLAQTDNVRAALLLVSRGEAPLGIVYKTDAAADPAVAIVGTFPEDSHPPVIYPAALVASAGADAAAFLGYLSSAAAKAAFEAQAFIVLP